MLPCAWGNPFRVATFGCPSGGRATPGYGWAAAARLGRTRVTAIREHDLALADVFDQAKKVALPAMGAVFLNQPTPPDFPTDLFPLFERFGKSLKADEGVAFPAEDARPAFTYDQKLRRHLVSVRSGTVSPRAWIFDPAVIHVVSRRDTTLMPRRGRRRASAPSPKRRA